MKIIHRNEDGSFKAIIRVFEPEGRAAPLFQRADYEPLMEKIQLRADRGVLMGEMGHPVIGEGFSDEYRNQRYLQIHEDMVCCRFSDVKFEQTEADMQDVLTAVIHPVGRFKDVFQDVLQFPEKYEFSVRAFSKGWRANGPTMDIFVTWDLIPAANLARVIRLEDLQLS
jgi:hypothetical protein